MNKIVDFDHTALAELISRRWREDKPYFTLKRIAPGAWLEGSWWRQPANSALKLRWSRWSAALQMQAAFARTALQEPSRGDSV
jgi:hypothetical protein